MRDHYPETIVPESRPGDPNTAVREISTEQAAREEALVREVVASFDDTPSPWLKQLIEALARHLHALVRETRLTTEEWDAAIRFLTRCGHITDDRRQEFILLSDVLGVSMQTIAVNNEAHGNATEATVFGPFFVEGSPEIPIGGDMANGAVGEPCWVEGVVTGTDGKPVAGARIEVWGPTRSASTTSSTATTARRPARICSAMTRAGTRSGASRRCPTRSRTTARSDLLAATGRSPMRAAHLHFMVSADGLHTLVTHVFVPGDEYLDSDAVFGVKQSLVKDFAKQDAGTPTPDGRQVDGPWWRARFDIVLAPARGTKDEDVH